MKTVGIVSIVFLALAVVFGVLIATPLAKHDVTVTTYKMENVTTITNQTIANRHMESLGNTDTLNSTEQWASIPGAFNSSFVT